MARNGHVNQAGTIPYRESPLGGLEVLLISSRSGSWSFPKGGIKKGHTAIKTARLETLEEAGALGVLDDQPLGSFSFRKQGRRHDVRVYGLRVDRLLDRWAEERKRSRVWVPIAEAPALLGREALAPLLVKLHHRLLTQTRIRGRRAA